MTEANIPRKYWPFSAKKFCQRCNLIGKKLEVTEFVYKKQAEWSLNYNFIIEGLCRDPDYSPAEIRRALGMAILINGIGYAILNEKIYCDYGRYLSFNQLITMLSDKDLAYSNLDQLSKYHYLFISDVENFNSRMSGGLVEALKARLDDLLRRRQDAGRINIISFAAECTQIFTDNKLGNEIHDILFKCYDSASYHDPEERIVKVANSVGSKSGLEE